VDSRPVSDGGNEIIDARDWSLDDNF